MGPVLCASQGLHNQPRALGTLGRVPPRARAKTPRGSPPCGVSPKAQECARRDPVPTHPRLNTLEDPPAKASPFGSVIPPPLKVAPLPPHLWLPPPPPSPFYGRTEWIHHQKKCKAGRIHHKVQSIAQRDHVFTVVHIAVSALEYAQPAVPPWVGEKGS